MLANGGWTRRETPVVACTRVASQPAVGRSESFSHGAPSLIDTREELKKVFDMFDSEGSGKITFANLKRVAKELGENMNDEELQSMLAHADHSGNGAVSMDDFYRLMKKGGGKKNKIDELLGDDD